jgi:site-specific DNA-cytosine methylase
MWFNWLHGKEIDSFYFFLFILFTMVVSNYSLNEDLFMYFHHELKKNKAHLNGARLEDSLRKLHKNYDNLSAVEKQDYHILHDFHKLLVKIELCPKYTFMGAHEPNSSELQKELCERVTSLEFARVMSKYGCYFIRNSQHVDVNLRGESIPVPQSRSIFSHVHENSKPTQSLMDYVMRSRYLVEAYYAGHGV